MKKLDLHGIRHDDVDRLVENFIFKEDFPHQIITGHSTKMNSIVVNVLERHMFYLGIYDIRRLWFGHGQGEE